MPYINIRVGTRLTDQQRAELAGRTTDAMNTIMGKKRVVTVVHIDESVAQNWSVNGRSLTPVDARPAYVDIKITEGTNNAAQKSEMIRTTAQMLKDVLGAVQEAAYVVIDDVAGDSWGYNGRTQADRARERSSGPGFVQTRE